MKRVGGGIANRFWRSGDPYIWWTGAAVAASLLLVAGLVLIVLTRGLGYFWPADVVRIEHTDGVVSIGEVKGREAIPVNGSPSERAYRIQLKVGNRDLYGQDFRWIDEREIVARSSPGEILAIERWERGNFYALPLRLEADGKVIPAGDGLMEAFSALHTRLSRIRDEVYALEKHEVGAINRRIESARLRIRELERSGESPNVHQAILDQERVVAEAEAAYQEVLLKIRALRAEMEGPALVVQTAEGTEHALPVSEIVRAYHPNGMNPIEKSWLYLVKLWEFVAGEPRESNTEGGIFPAIFGTVLMVIVMTVAVLPLGVLAAVYLKEYAGDGFVVAALRVAIRNLAGVPSIVYGVFGMGFFIYFVGGGIDRLFFPERLPTPTFGTGGILWASLTLALLTLPVVIVATEEGLTSVPTSMREASYALGATKFETVWKVVVPNALPGILTGMILGIARATGEVAPLMMTGVVKLAPELAVDGVWPFIHLERKFMHLGFYIYDLGFQSPNVEAARPMLFATTLALLVVVFALNIVGITLRNRMRARRAGSAT